MDDEIPIPEGTRAEVVNHLCEVLRPNGFIIEGARFDYDRPPISLSEILLALSRRTNLELLVRADSPRYVDARIRRLAYATAFHITRDLTPRRKNGQPDRRYSERVQHYIAMQTLVSVKRGRPKYRFVKIPVPAELVRLLFGTSKAVLGL